VKGQGVDEYLKELENDDLSEKAATKAVKLEKQETNTD
jgi:hypothetical protein